MLNVEATSYILKKGSVISTRINSSGPWLYNVVCGVHGNMLDILLIDRYIEYPIFNGCNFTLKFNNNYYEYLFEGTVAEIKTASLQYITLKIIRAEEKINVRNFPRYDTHLPAGISTIWSQNESYCVITNLSLSGISFSSKSNFDVQEECFLSIYFPSGSTVLAKGKILRKSSKNAFYEYGMAFTDMTEENSQQISVYLLSLENSIAELCDRLAEE